MKAQHRSLPRLFTALLAISCASANAVITSISRQGTDVVLSWPSTPGQQFTVQFRQTVDTNSVWTTLTNGLSAAADTNYATFIHAGVLPESGQQMQAEGGAATQRVQLSAEELEVLRAQRKAEADKVIAWLTAQLCEAAAKAQAWREEVAKNPALLQAAREQAAAASATTLDSESASCGFYRVLHTPTWSIDPTGYTFDGPTYIPVDFADYMDRVEDILVLINGVATPYAEFMPYVYQGVTNWGMGIYFDRLPNGGYQLQLQSKVRLNDSVGEDSAYVLLSNRSVSVTIDCDLSFTNWSDLAIGSNHTFRAQSKTLDTDWTIEIHDVEDVYVNGASGHTSNGQIEWTWDMTDIWGKPRTDLDYDPYFLPYFTMGGSGFAPPPPKSAAPVRIDYPAVGGWIVTYQDTFYMGTDAEYYTNAMNNIAGGPPLWDNPLHYQRLKFGTNYTQSQRNDSYIDLKAWMFHPTFRNFYYFGHANAASIGCDAHIYDTNGVATGGTSFSGSKAFLDSKTVKSQITSSKRPYRFTFLDGCNTANGDWPDAFGIGRGTNNLAYYQNPNRNPRTRPSAFVGWAVKPGGQGWGTVRTYFEFREDWMGFWAVDPTETLIGSLQDARDASNWVPENQFWNGIRVFGYLVLGFDEYNRKTEW